MGNSKLTNNVLFLGFASFLNDLSSEMIMPILPMFITALGGAGIVVGFVGGLRTSISSLLSVVCGHWSDKIGKRKIFVSSGYFTSAVFKILLSFSKVWQQIIVFASFERIGKGLRTAPRDAIIADSMPSARGRGFGIHRTLDTAGAILGSVVVFFLFWFLGFGFNSIILIAGIFSLLAISPLYFVKEPKKKVSNINLKLSLKKLPKNLKLFILISGTFALANFSYMFFILRAKGLFSGKMAVGVPILLYILFNIFYAGFAIPSGNLSDKIGREKVLVLGYFLFSLVSLGFAVFNSLHWFIVLFILYGIVYALVDGNQRAFVSDLSGERLKGTALGIFHTVIGLVTLPASVIAGFLWQLISPSATFVYGFLVSIASVLIFLIFRNSFK